MNNTIEKDWLKPNICNKSMPSSTTTRRTTYFWERNTGFENSIVSNKETKQNGFGGVVPRPSNANSLKIKEINQLFKIPNFDNLPVKKATVKSIISPRKRVQAGRVKNDLKTNAQGKMSFIPRPSFINNRKSLHGSRSTQANARKELIKKMVFIAECALKEGREINKENKTPVKLLAGLTPRKTPASKRGPLVVPEFNKKPINMEDIKTPIQDFVRKEMYGHTVKPIPFSENRHEDIVKPSEETKLNCNLEVEQLQSDVSENNARFTQILTHCKVYNAGVNSIYEKLKSLDDCFESNLRNIPDYEVYNQFCGYQSKKEQLYNELQYLEEELKNFVKTHTNIGNKLKGYIKRKKELFEKQSRMHEDFVQVVNKALEKCTIKTEEEGETRKEEEKEKKEEKAKEETPKLRRSLRLSKLPKKGKFEERTPMTRKLKKLDSKSRGIQKCTKIRSP